MEEHTFEGLGEFREVLPQLATASAHDVFVDLGAGYGAGRDSPRDPKRVGHKAIWNDRDDRLAYIGTEKYTITQHEEMLRYIDEAVGQTVGEVDIGRIRDYGERLDGMITLDGHSIDVGELVGEGYVPPDSSVMETRASTAQEGIQDDTGWTRDILGVGIRFGNSFDGSEKVNLETMGYRFICQNWMVWGEETIGSHEQLHMDELKPEHVEELIFDVLDKQDEAEGIVADAVEDRIKPSWAAPLLDDAGFGPRYQKNIIEELFNYDMVDGEWSRWALYNSAVYILDHNVVQDVNPNVYDRHQDKANYILVNDVSSPDEEVPLAEVLDLDEEQEEALDA